MGVRCSLRLEAPVADEGVVIVPDDYLLYLVRNANEKFEENKSRIERFEQQLRAAFNPSAVQQQQQQQQQQSGTHRFPRAHTLHPPDQAASDSAVLAPRRRRQWPPSASSAEAALEPRPETAAAAPHLRLLLGRQLQLLKRIKAAEKKAQALAQAQQTPSMAEQSAVEIKANLPPVAVVDADETPPTGSADFRGKLQRSVVRGLASPLIGLAHATLQTSAPASRRGLRQRSQQSRAPHPWLTKSAAGFHSLPILLIFTLAAAQWAPDLF